MGFAGAGAVCPVLGGAELVLLLADTPPARHESGVGFADWAV